MEAARWQKAVEPVLNDYVRSMADKGYPAAESQRWIAFLRERIQYWSAQQASREIPSLTR